MMNWACEVYDILCTMVNFAIDEARMRFMNHHSYLTFGWGCLNCLKLAICLNLIRF